MKYNKEINDLVDQIAELEVKALLEGLQDEELRKNPQFLDKVRKFLQNNNMMTIQDVNTEALIKESEKIIKLPVFDYSEGALN